LLSFLFIPHLRCAQHLPGQRAITGERSSEGRGKIYYIDDIVKEFNRPCPYVIYIYIRLRLINILEGCQKFGHRKLSYTEISLIFSVHPHKEQVEIQRIIETVILTELVSVHDRCVI
jgi:hypothetical protein